MSEAYMNTKVRPILEQIVDSLLDNTPEDPILFMYKWLVNYKNSQTLKDRIELESLREKIKKYQNQNDESYSNLGKNEYKESFIKEDISSDIENNSYSNKS